MNILKSGAIPDGNTDASKAFMRAMKTGLAEIPPGQFFLADPLPIPSTTMLRGSGPASMVIGQLLMDDVNSITINDLTVGSVAIQNASYRIRTSNLIVEGLLLSPAPYVTPVGILIEDAYMLYFQSPQIRNCVTAIQITNDPVAADPVTTANALSIFGGEIQQNTVGMDVRGAFGILLSGMTIQGQVKGGILLRSGIHGFTARDCYFEVNTQADPKKYYDIDVGSEGVCYSVTVDGCRFTSSAAQKQAVAIRSQRCVGITFANSLVWGYQKAGLLSIGPSGFIGGLVQQVQTSGGIPAYLAQ